MIILQVAQVIKIKLLCKLGNANYMSFILDGSTEKERIGDIVLYVRVTKHAKVRDEFISI
jgi:hypothetical protein